MWRASKTVEDTSWVRVLARFAWFGVALLTSAASQPFMRSTAVAVPVSLPVSVSTGLGSTVWVATNDSSTSGGAFGGFCGYSPALGLTDAGSAAGSASGAFDAYDEAWSVWIDGVPFVAPATVDLTGTTLLAGPVPMSGLNVWVQYFFSINTQAMRMLVFLQNSTASTITAVVEVPVNFGSDSYTQVDDTSSGDTSVTVADRWVVTSDGGRGDPVNTSVFYGPGAPAVAPFNYTQTVFECSGSEGLGATFNISVPANSARALMFFAALGDILGTGNPFQGPRRMRRYSIR
ncbi:MAG: hypothetical protein N3C12_02655 [Candidatus Binatia bacterium]|nr:hypothetical protein [Candidatus Binatia bacterium]